MTAALLLLLQVATAQPVDFCTVPFSPATVQVSPPGIDSPADYEFDRAHLRIMYATPAGVAYVQPLDPVTGFATGTRVKVATGIVRKWPALGLPLLGNGPEWDMWGVGLYFMRAYDTTSRALWRAWEWSPGSWVQYALPEGEDRGFPWPSRDQPLVLYAKVPPAAQSVLPYDLALRENDDPATEHLVPVPAVAKVGGPRWVQGHREVVLTMLDLQGVEQIALYDVDTHAIEQVTDHTAADSVSIDETWTSSDAGSFVIWFVANGTEIRTLAKVGDAWAEVNRVNPSQVLGRPGKPYLASPEPISYGGHEYISLTLTAAPGLGFAAADVLLTTPWASAPCHFRTLTTPHDGVTKIAPEPLALTGRLVLYYTVVAPDGTHTLHMAETGL